MRQVILLTLIVILGGCHQDPQDDPGNSGIPQYIETFQPCMDIVSRGGAVQVAIRNQLEYDSLYFARFQMPLDDYWNEHYESVLATVMENHPGLSKAEYDALVREVFYSALPFRGTDTCTTPFVDFTQYTLLGQDAHAAGCTLPDYHISVFRDDFRQELIYTLIITEYGSCEPGLIRNKWILVPKIPPSFRVVFQREYIQK